MCRGGPPGAVTVQQRCPPKKRGPSRAADAAFLRNQPAVDPAVEQRVDATWRGRWFTRYRLKTRSPLSQVLLGSLVHAAEAIQELHHRPGGSAGAPGSPAGGGPTRGCSTAWPWRRRAPPRIVRSSAQTHEVAPAGAAPGSGPRTPPRRCRERAPADPNPGGDCSRGTDRRAAGHPLHPAGAKGRGARPRATARSRGPRTPACRPAPRRGSSR